MSEKTYNEQLIATKKKDGDSGRQQTFMMQEVTAGPLPHPDIMKRYEEICPGAAERILVLAEKQQEHRQQMERMIINTEKRDSLLGIISAFLLCMMCFATAIVIVVFVPKEAAAIFSALLGGSGILAVSIPFLKFTKSDKKDKE